MKSFSAIGRSGVLCLFMLACNVDALASNCIKDQYGNVVCGEGACATDQYGKVFCAKAGGGAERDQFGTVRCGVGNCAKDDQGRLKCSTKPGGGAQIDSYGKVKCSGGCQDARRQLCEAAR